MKTININNLEKKYNSKIQNKAYIYCNDGICNIKSSSGVFGIQLYFKGKAEITSKLPDEWILQGNKKTILIYTLQNITMKNQILFEYKGYIKIMKAIIVNKNNEKLSEKITINNSNWDNQKFDFSIDTTNWKEYKNNERKGLVKTTSYNLPDYGLPKVDKTKIKTKRRTSTSSYTTGGGSSGGSGGY